MTTHSSTSSCDTDVCKYYALSSTVKKELRNHKHFFEHVCSFFFLVVACISLWVYSRTEKVTRERAERRAGWAGWQLRNVWKEHKDNKSKVTHLFYVSDLSRSLVPKNVLVDHPHVGDCDVSVGQRMAPHLYVNQAATLRVWFEKATFVLRKQSIWSCCYISFFCCSFFSG